MHLKSTRCIKEIMLKNENFHAFHLLNEELQFACSSKLFRKRFHKGWNSFEPIPAKYIFRNLKNQFQVSFKSIDFSNDEPVTLDII